MQEGYMRITVTLDDDLLKEAQELTGITERSRLIREGLHALIQRESSRRLARLGGTMPDIDDVPRRRPLEGTIQSYSDPIEPIGDA